MPESMNVLEFERPVADLETKISELKNISVTESVNLDKEIQSLESKRDRLVEEIFSNLTPWQKVQLARHPKRPHTSDYIQALITDFIELHGDRCFADDEALFAGCGMIDGMPVLVMGQQKGRNIEDSMRRNFGMMHPEGYRKAMRLMRLAEKSNLPVITFIDTAGAYPGIGAEERGQAEAIARNLRDMSVLKAPLISIVIGEGGSGGALGIGVTDKILMLENSWYSVISPEGCAAILFRDAARAPDAAQALKLTAKDLREIGIVDEIVPEPAGGAHRNPAVLFETLKAVILKHLKELKAVPIPELLEKRYQKYRSIGVWSENTARKANKPAKTKKGR